MRSGIIVTLCGLLAATAAQAQDQKPASPTPAAPATECKLVQVTALDMTMSPDGVMVPLMINGVSKNFKLDLASSASYLAQSTVDDLKLPTTSMRRPVPSNGYLIKQNATVAKFQIGPLAADNQTIQVLPKDALKDGVGGLLGAAVLSDLDIDLDFTNHKLKLFRTNHCPGRVVYWTNSPAAEIPFELDPNGHLVIAGQLNDKPLSIAIGTGASSILPMGLVNDQFGLDQSSAGMAPAPTGAGPADVPATQVFNYRFKTLSASGVTLNNPLLVVYGPNRMDRCPSKLSDPMERCAGQPDLNLGLPELTKFHIYVSSKEKLIYLTAADAH